MQIQAPEVSPATGVLSRVSCFIFVLAFLLNEVRSCPQASLFWAQIIRRAKLDFSFLNPANPSERCLALNNKDWTSLQLRRRDGDSVQYAESVQSCACALASPSRGVRLPNSSLSPPPGPSWH